MTIPLVSTGSRGVRLEQISFGLSCSWGLDVGETEMNSVVKSIMYKCLNLYIFLCQNYNINYIVCGGLHLKKQKKKSSGHF